MGATTIHSLAEGEFGEGSKAFLLEKEKKSNVMSAVVQR